MPSSFDQIAPRSADAPAHAVRCLKAAGDRSVWLVARPGEAPRTLKSWPLDAMEAMKFVVGMTQPQRHLRAVRRLRNARVNTPRLARRPRVSRRDGRLFIELELEHVAGENALEVLRAGEADLVQRAASSIGCLLANLIEARLFNRDLKLSNIVIDEQGGAWLIDPVAIRRMREPRREVARMLERLAVEAREQGMTIPRNARRTVVELARGTLDACPSPP